MKHVLSYITTSMWKFDPIDGRDKARSAKHSSLRFYLVCRTNIPDIKALDNGTLRFLRDSIETHTSQAEMRTVKAITEADLLYQGPQNTATWKIMKFLTDKHLTFFSSKKLNDAIQGEQKTIVWWFLTSKRLDAAGRQLVKKEKPEWFIEHLVVKHLFPTYHPCQDYNVNQSRRFSRQGVRVTFDFKYLQCHPRRVV